MTTVGELFHTVDRDEVIAAILRLYPCQPGAHPHGYVQAWDILQNKQAATPTGMTVELYMAPSFDDPPEDYVSVHGRDEAGEAWAIEYNPWAEWLCMNVRVLPEVGAITPVDLLAHIFWEMTWAGYDDQEIEDQINDIKDAADDVRSIIEADAPKQS